MHPSFPRSSVLALLAPCVLALASADAGTNLDAAGLNGRVVVVLGCGEPDRIGGLCASEALAAIALARDAFNGVLLWKRPLAGFGTLAFEAIGPSQPTLWNCWSAPAGGRSRR